MGLGIEADVIINGTPLTHAQAMSLRVAVTNMLVELAEPEFMQSLGPVGESYRARLFEVQSLMLSPQSNASSRGGSHGKA